MSTAYRVFTLLIAAALAVGCRTSRPVTTTVPLAPPLTAFEQAVIATGCKRDSKVKDSVRYHKQDTTMWCWVASAQMVMDYFATSVQQCTQVNDYCAEKKLKCASINCCQQPNECLTGGWPLLGKYGFSFQDEPRHLEAEEVVRELACKHKPFLFSWKDVGGSGHMMVAIDFLTVKGKDYLLIHDPLLGNKGDTKRLPYSIYKTGNYLHWRDYFNITRELQ